MQRRFRRRSGRLCRARSSSTARSGSTGTRRRFRRRSGRLWCRVRSGSTGSEKFLEKVWEALLQRRFRRRSGRLCRARSSSTGSGESQVRFNRVPKKVPEKVWEALVQSQVRINRFREVSGEGLGGFVAEQGQFQQGSREGSGEGLGGCSEEGSVEDSGRLWCRAGQVQQGSGYGDGLGGFGAEPGQVQQGFEESSGEGLGGFGAEPGHVQPGSGGSGEGSQVRYNRSGEGLGGFGAEPGQAQSSGEGSEEGSGRLLCKAKSISTVSEKVAEAKPGQVHLTHGNLAEVFPALGFAARFRKICKNKMLWLLGIPPKLLLSVLFI